MRDGTMRSKRRAIFLWVLFFAVIVIAGNVLLFVEKPQVQVTPDVAALPLCSTTIETASSLGQSNVTLQRVEIVTLGDFGQISFRPSTTEGAPCMIDITAAPPSGSGVADWRLGLSLESPQQYAGKDIEFTFLLDADKDKKFPSSSFYVYDGSKLTAAGVPEVKSEIGTTAVLRHHVSDDAPVLEFWLRLVSPNTKGERILETGRLMIRRIEVKVLD